MRLFGAKKAIMALGFTDALLKRIKNCITVATV
jgi:hypothetical protein